MALSKQEVEHIAKLARIELTSEEEEKFSKELSSILDYVGQLNELDTTKVKPTARVTKEVNVWREDKIQECQISADDLLKNAPELQDNYIKVKAVLE